MTAGLTLVFLDQTSVSVALPSIARDLDASRTELVWVVNAFLLPIAALAAVAARLGDLYGRSRVLVVGLVVFSAASLACGLAPSEGWLIAGRGVQGVGAAAMMPLTTAIVADTFGEDQRGRALGIYIAVASLFLSIGPLVGGALSEYASWRWIFFVNLPVAAATVVITRRYAGAKRPAAVEGGLDVAGGAILVGGLGAVVLALLQGPDWGWGSVATLGVFAAGGGLLAVFPWVEARRPHPLLPLGLLADRVFLGATVAVLCSGFVTVGALVLSAIYLQDELHLRPLQAGLALLPATIPMLLAAPLGGELTDRFGPRSGTTVGFLLVAAALLALGLLAPDAVYVDLWPAFVAFGAGVGLVTVTTSTAGMDVAGSRQRGGAAGMLTTARQVGGTVGLAAMTAVFIASERAHEPSRTAIGSGFEAALLVAAGVSTLAALVAFLLLRHSSSG
jgi:EmrB/QacA subfamily drug resistance transporter